MTGLGLSLPLNGFSLAECVGVAQTAEALDYQDVWTSEIAGADGVTLLAAIAASTKRIRLGTGILPVYTRPPALLAMTAASLQELSGGRFVLGLGTSTEVVVNRWMGLDLDRPLTRMSETLDVLELALAGDRVHAEGRTLRSAGFRLQLAVSKPVPVILGALGPKMLHLAGTRCAGVMLSHAPLSQIERVLEPFWDGVSDSGRARDEVEVLQRVPVAIDEDEDFLIPALRRELAGYGRAASYRSFFARHGFSAVATRLADAWKGNDFAAAAAAVTDELIAETFVIGDAAASRRRLDAYRKAGVTTRVVLPISVVRDSEERKQRRLAVLDALAG